EARLYLRVTRCTACREGPLQISQIRPVEHEAASSHVTIDTTCGRCSSSLSFAFEVPAGTASDQGEAVPQINPTAAPSRIIDVAHWLTLFGMRSEEAGRETDKTRARQLWMEVGQYLTEALKFYDDPDSDLPPPEAFFTDRSRARLRENPEHFSRQRLIGLKARLPVPLTAFSAHNRPNLRAKSNDGDGESD
ncbi:MAG: hypothetical protein ACE5HE_11580, partial [Phycisphaerae bacterium]